MNQKWGEELDRVKLNELTTARQPDTETSMLIDGIVHLEDTRLQRKLIWHLLATVLNRGIELGLQFFESQKSNTENKDESGKDNSKESQD